MFLGNFINGADGAYKPAYKKHAKNAGFGLNQSSLIGTADKAKQASVGGNDGIDKSLEVVQLGQKKNPLSSSDNSGHCIEAEGTRTLNLRIDRPNRGFRKYLLINH